MKVSYINLPVFLITFLIGIVLVYFTAPDSKIVTVYPTSDNQNMFQFRDKANNCFKLNQDITKCTKDSEVIPIQI